jgi:hypothetical protein
MGTVRFTQKTYPLGTEPNFACDKALAVAESIEDEELIRKLYRESNETDEQKQHEFFDLAERFRLATDAEEIKRLGDQMGRMVFGG